MSLSIEATYRNGVFVPRTSPPLNEEARVRLVVEPIEAGGGAQRGAAVPRLRRDRRIQLPAGLAQEIATAPQFDPWES